MRNIADFAGVHIYNYGNDPIYVNDRLIGVYSDTDEEIHIKPKTDAKLQGLFDGGLYKTVDKVLKVSSGKGQAKMFLLPNL